MSDSSKYRFVESVELNAEQGPLLHVLGADIVDGTPIYDIKPYIPYSDCHVDATEGFTSHTSQQTVEVIFDEKFLNQLPVEKRQAAIDMLAQDPRPAYAMDENRIYGIWFDEYNIKFVGDERSIRVCEIERKNALK